MGPNFAQGQPGRMAEDASHWSNAIAPYAKNVGIMEAPGLPAVTVYAGYPTSGNPGQTAAPALSNLTFNGMLHTWSATAVAAPSQLPLIWEGRGKGNAVGAALSNPAIVCPVGTNSCTYSPEDPVTHQCGATTSTMFVIYNSMWMYNKGGNVTFCDTSAKFRKFGATLAPGNTDAKVDPYTGYDAVGNPPSYYTTPGGCNAWLFRPDYDFSN